MKNLRGITNSYCNYLERLELGRLHMLDQFVSQDITFKDPFHETNGISNLKKILSTMFVKFDGVEFKTKKIFLNLDSTEDSASFWWTLRMRHIKSTRLIEIDGMSFINIESKGLISRHEEYWDPTSNVYQLIPIVGLTLSVIKKKIAKKADLPHT